LSQTMPPSSSRSTTTLISAIGPGEAKPSNDRPGGDDATATSWPWRRRVYPPTRAVAYSSLPHANTAERGNSLRR
jgi:hypothetical protein